MVESELQELIKKIQLRKCEGQTTEVKSAHQGCPKRLYDTLSAFANQDSGGVIVFGLDEQQGFAKVGVYDAQDLQKRVMEYGEQMSPVVRPVFTVCDEDGKVFVSAEIPSVDVVERPCFNAAKGRLQGAYVRVGDADKPMTDYEVYSYEAFRRRVYDDIREAERVSLGDLEPDALNGYLARKRLGKPNLAKLSGERQAELAKLMREGKVTLAAALLFGLYPQGWYPQLAIIATCIPGYVRGVCDDDGNRFIASKRIEGTLPEMLETAVAFVAHNMSTAIKIDERGRRIDTPQYPLRAVREAILNALIHRDYSIHTENMPIQLEMYTDRLEITNPGGLYGRLTIDQLGTAQPDTRNPVLATAMETLEKTKNRYSGIPTIRSVMAHHGLPEPIFENLRGTFKVTLYHAGAAAMPRETESSRPRVETADLLDEKGLLEFCRVPRTRAEIMEHLGMEAGRYALRRYLEPLMQVGAIRMTLPEKPRSHKQQFVTVAGW